MEINLFIFFFFSFLFFPFITPFMSNVTEKKPLSKAKETAIGFITGGLAACGAVTFTNPWEVCV